MLLRAPSITASPLDGRNIVLCEVCLPAVPAELLSFEALDKWDRRRKSWEKSTADRLMRGGWASNKFLPTGARSGSGTGSRTGSANRFANRFVHTFGNRLANKFRQPVPLPLRSDWFHDQSRFTSSVPSNRFTNRFANRFGPTGWAPTGGSGTSWQIGSANRFATRFVPTASTTKFGPTRSRAT